MSHSACCAWADGVSEHKGVAALRRGAAKVRSGGDLVTLVQLSSPAATFAQPLSPLASSSSFNRAGCQRLRDGASAGFIPLKISGCQCGRSDEECLPRSSARATTSMLDAVSSADEFDGHKRYERRTGSLSSFGRTVSHVCSVVENSESPFVRCASIRGPRSAASASKRMHWSRTNDIHAAL